MTCVKSSRSSSKRSKRDVDTSSDDSSSDSGDHRRSKHGRSKSRTKDRRDHSNRRDERRKDDRRYQSRHRTHKQRHDDDSDLGSEHGTVARVKFQKKARSVTKPLRGTSGQKYTYLITLHYPWFKRFHEIAYNLGRELGVPKPVSMMERRKRKRLEAKWGREGRSRSHR